MVSNCEVFSCSPATHVFRFGPWLFCDESNCIMLNLANPNTPAETKPTQILTICLLGSPAWLQHKPLGTHRDRRRNKQLLLTKQKVDGWMWFRHVQIHACFKPCQTPTPLAKKQGWNEHGFTLINYVCPGNFWAHGPWKIAGAWGIRWIQASSCAHCVVLVNPAPPSFKFL